MNLVDHEKHDGMKVWLDKSEVDLLLSEAQNTEQKLAFLLGVRSGLRSKEIITVKPRDIVETSAGPRVRVMDSKGDKSRETPAPPELVHTAEAFSDARGMEPDDKLVDRSRRSIGRWVDRAAERLQARTGDPGWKYLTPHDLRRTWATLLAAEDVDPLLVCDWGGWSDLETFLEHYRGSYSPQVQREQIKKVGWLGYNREESGSPVSNPHSESPQTPFQNGQ